MTPIEKIKAEIERLKEIRKTIESGKHFNEGYCDALMHLSNFIESLEKEMPSIHPCEVCQVGIKSTEQPQEQTIKGWVARDECLCFFQGEKPTLNEETNLWYNTEYDPIYLDESLFPDIQLENSPVEFELTIHKLCTTTKENK